MQSKSTRGVQQEDVWAAADALVAAGERPTIERVRLKIGRGSPNTVSPMLESWFATLAPRLGVAASGGAQPAENGAPQALRQALDAVWSNAVTAARDRAEAALAPERDKLAQLDKELDSQRQMLLERESVLAQRGATFEHALELLRAQLRDQAVQLEKAGRELERARSSLATLVQERDADRRQFDDQLRALAEERRRTEERTSANERRFLEEVDRARQEAKQATQTLEDASQKHVAQKQVLGERNLTLINRVHEGHVEISALNERLQGALEQVRGLEKRIEGATSGAAPGLRSSAKRRRAKPPEEGDFKKGDNVAKRTR